MQPQSVSPNHSGSQALVMRHYAGSLLAAYRQHEKAWYALVGATEQLIAAEAAQENEIFQRALPPDEHGIEARLDELKPYHDEDASAEVNGDVEIADRNELPFAGMDVLARYGAREGFPIATMAEAGYEHPEDSFSYLPAHLGTVEHAIDRAEERYDFLYFSDPHASNLDWVDRFEEQSFAVANDQPVREWQAFLDAFRDYKIAAARIEKANGLWKAFRTDTLKSYSPEAGWSQFTSEVHIRKQILAMYQSALECVNDLKDTTELDTLSAEEMNQFTGIGYQIINAECEMRQWFESTQRVVGGLNDVSEIKHSLKSLGDTPSDDESRKKKRELEDDLERVQETIRHLKDTSYPPVWLPASAYEVDVRDSILFDRELVWATGLVSSLSVWLHQHLPSSTLEHCESLHTLDEAINTCDDLYTAWAKEAKDGPDGGVIPIAAAPPKRVALTAYAYDVKLAMLGLLHAKQGIFTMLAQSLRDGSRGVATNPYYKKLDSLLHAVEVCDYQGKLEDLLKEVLALPPKITEQELPASDQVVPFSSEQRAAYDRLLSDEAHFGKLLKDFKNRDTYFRVSTWPAMIPHKDAVVLYRAAETNVLQGIHTVLEQLGSLPQIPSETLEPLRARFNAVATVTTTPQGLPQVRAKKTPQPYAPDEASHLDLLLWRREQSSLAPEIRALADDVRVLGREQAESLRKQQNPNTTLSNGLQVLEQGLKAMKQGWGRYGGLC